MKKILPLILASLIATFSVSAENKYYLRAEVGDLFDYFEQKGVPPLDFFSFANANEYHRISDFLERTKLKPSAIGTVIVTFDLTRLQEKKFPGLIGVKIRGKDAQTAIKTILALIPVKEQGDFIRLEEGADLSLHTGKDYLAVGRPSELKKIKSKQTFNEFMQVIRTGEIAEEDKKSVFLVHWSWDKKVKDQLLDLARSRKEAEAMLRNPYVKSLLGTEKYTSYITLDEGIKSITNVHTSKGTSNTNLVKVAHAAQVMMSVGLSFAESFLAGGLGSKKNSDGQPAKITKAQEESEKKKKAIFQMLQNVIVRMAVKQQETGITITTGLKEAEADTLFAALKDRIRVNKKRLDNERIAQKYLNDLCVQIQDPQGQKAQEMIRKNKQLLAGRKFYEYSYHMCEGEYLFIKLANHANENLLIDFLPEDAAAVINSAPITPTNYRNVLHIAAEQGKLKTVQFLIEKGMYQDSTDATGKNALYLAAENNKVAVVKYLLEKGAMIADDSAGVSPITAAENAGHKEVAEILRNAKR